MLNLINCKLYIVHSILYFSFFSINPFVTLIKFGAKKNPSLLLIKASTDLTKNCILSLRWSR